MTKIMCPSCLAEVAEAELKNANYTCLRCQKPVPPPYLADYGQHKPVVVSAVGLRGHGKTVYFASLFRAMYLLTECWPEFYHMPLDDTTLKRVKEEVERLDRGELPAPTPFNPNNPPEPVLIRVAGIPMYPRSTLLFYDASGESFAAEMEKLGSLVPFLQRAQTAMFLISVPDLLPRPDLVMKELLSRYIGGMRHQRINTRKRHLVVVYTKADQMNFTGSRWKDLDTYLRKGLGDGLEDPEGYRKKMVWASEQLRDYTKSGLKAHQFLAMANGNFDSITFSMVSALGARPETGADGQQRLIEVAPVPCRIMDPLLWIVENSQPRWRRFSWWKRNWRKVLLLSLICEVSSVMCSVIGVFLGAQVGVNLASWNAPWQWALAWEVLPVSEVVGSVIGMVSGLLAFFLATKVIKRWLD